MAELQDRPENARRRTRLARRFGRTERGATSIEYALIVGLVFLTIVTGIRSFARENGEMYDDISSAVQKR